MLEPSDVHNYWSLIFSSRYLFHTLEYYSYSCEDIYLCSLVTLNLLLMRVNISITSVTTFYARKT